MTNRIALKPPRLRTDHDDEAFGCRRRLQAANQRCSRSPLRVGPSDWQPSMSNGCRRRTRPAEMLPQLLSYASSNGELASTTETSICRSGTSQQVLSSKVLRAVATN